MKRVFLLMLVLIFSAVISNVQAQSPFAAGPFTDGNIVIYRFNDGGNKAGVVPGYLDEFTPEGTFVRTVPMPTVADGANRAFMAGLFGQAREGLMDLSADGRYLSVIGAEGPRNGSDYANYPKVIGRISGNGEINTTTAIKTEDIGNVGRQVASSDGTGFYTAGGQGRVTYVPLGFNSGKALADFESSYIVGGNGANFALKVFKGKLYISAGTGASSSLNGVVGMLAGTLPTPTENIDPSYNPSDFALAGLVQPNEFVMFDTNNDNVPDLIYVLDVTTNANTVVRKYSYGEIAPGFGSWTSLGSFTHGKMKDAKAITGRIVNGDARLFLAQAPSGGGPSITRINDPIFGTMANSGYFQIRTPNEEDRSATDFDESKAVISLVYGTTNAFYKTMTSANINFRGVAFAPAPFTVTPVKLTSFTGNANNYEVALKWSTASESNNSHFEILRSNGGENFKVIGTVKGNGTSNIAQHYAFADKSPAEGVNYYRLKQVDFDGSSEDPTTIAVNFGLNGKVMSGYFVSDSEIQLSIYATANTRAQLSVTDLNGKVVVKTNVTLTDSNNLMKIQTGNVAKGMYILTLVADGKRTSIKIIK